MTKAEFIEILTGSEPLTPDHTHELAAMVTEFPYFQAARALRLKGLKQNHHFAYNAELKKTAAYTTDRGILFDYITSQEFNQHQISEKIKSRNPEKEDSDQTAPQEGFDEALNMNIDEANKVLDPDLFEASPQKPVHKENQILGIGKPLEFNKNESHSFSEWLKLTSAKPIQREEPVPQPEPEEKQRKFKLIDEFITKNPKIVPSKEAPSKPKNIVTESEGSRLMTETLARVYLEQKNYEKAIQAYKILILKNPEKSGFFADQIRAIEKLQEK